MGRIVVACYSPKSGREKALAGLISNHMNVLRGEGLITDRKPVIMKAKNGTIVEVFEWKSAEAIEMAHTSPAVLKMWEAFEEVCNYEVASNLSEFNNLFSEFEPFQWDE